MFVHVKDIITLLFPLQTYCFQISSIEETIILILYIFFLSVYSFMHF